MNKDYSDIINLEHYTSLKHPRMSIYARSSQFAPFSALNGYEDSIRETARLTDKRIEIDEDLKEILDNKIMYILNNIDSNILVSFVYFVYDQKKDGGKYVEKVGVVKKIDIKSKCIILKDNTKIPMDEIINITSDVFIDND